MGLSVYSAVLLMIGAFVAARIPEDGKRISVLLAVLSLALLLRAALLLIGRVARRLFGKGPPGAAPPQPRSARTGGRRIRPVRPDSRKRIVVDGSNVMFWNGDPPRLETLTKVLDTLIARDFAPVVFFDANVGHKLFDKFHGSVAMARHLPVGVADVVVVDAGAPADPALIAHALRGRNRIVSNDRFRDWQGEFPELAKQGLLVSGNLRGGKVQLRL